MGFRRVPNTTMTMTVISTGDVLTSDGVSDVGRGGVVADVATRVAQSSVVVADFGGRCHLEQAGNAFSESRLRSGTVTPRSKKWPRIVAGLFFASMAVAMLLNRVLVVSAYGELQNLSGRSIVGLLVLIAVVKIFHTTMHWASLPDVPFPRVFQSTESYVGAANTVVGGAGLGTGLRVAMLRSWGVAPIDVAVSVLGTALAPSFALWGIAGAHTLPLLVTGRANGVERISACASICFLIGPGLFWWAALRFPSMLAWIARALEAGRRLLLAMIPSKHLARSLGRFDVPVHAEDMRLRGAALVRTRGWLMVGASACAQVSLGFLLIGCVQVVSPVTVTVETLTVLRAFALLRVLSSFVPLPAGLGVLDLGLLGVLTSGGVQRPTALAAIAIYRALTFVLPMVTGSACALAWRTSQRRTLPKVVPLVATMSSPDLAT